MPDVMPISVLIAGGKASGVGDGIIPTPQEVQSLVRRLDTRFLPQVVFLRNLQTDSDRALLFSRIGASVFGDNHDTVVLHDTATVLDSIKFCGLFYGVGSLRFNGRRIIFLTSSSLLAHGSIAAQNLCSVARLLPAVPEGIHLIHDEMAPYHSTELEYIRYIPGTDSFVYEPPPEEED